MVGGISMTGNALRILNRAHMTVSGPIRASNDNGPAEQKTVTVRRLLPMSGVEVKIKVPVSEFYGVAVSTTISADGELASTIELLHADPMLCYQVFSERGNNAVVAEWQNWGKKLRLPLYIRAGDGQLVAYSQQVSGVMVGNQTGRRMLSAEAERRTRFARRRKTGNDV